MICFIKVHLIRILSTWASEAGSRVSVTAEDQIKYPTVLWKQARMSSHMLSNENVLSATEVTKYPEHHKMAKNRNDTLNYVTPHPWRFSLGLVSCSTGCRALVAIPALGFTSGFTRAASIVYYRLKASDVPSTRVRESRLKQAWQADTSSSRSVYSQSSLEEPTVPPPRPTQPWLSLCLWTSWMSGVWISTDAYLHVTAAKKNKKTRD